MLVLCVMSVSAFGVEPPVPKEFLGDWAPQGASCQSAPKLRVQSNLVVLLNGSDSQTFGNLDLCYSCEGGAQYSGEVVWLVPEFGKANPAPFTVYFNAKEEKGMTLVKIEKPDLKKRFPLHNIKLQKCANKKLK